MKFIIYAGSPIPSEMEGTEVLAGTLAARLHSFEQAKTCILPLSDIEMNGLARSPELFPLHEAEVIFGLPGTSVTPIFDAAVGTAGLRHVVWDEMKARLRSDALSEQRTRETSPWNAPAPLGGDAPPASETEMEDAA